VLAAQQRADDAELQLHVMSQQSETRAVGLESRLSELSETLGNIERLRQQDQQIIQKLRERLVQVCNVCGWLSVINSSNGSSHNGRLKPLNIVCTVLKLDILPCSQ